MLDKMLDRLDFDRNRRWNANGKAAVALLFGFGQPADDDDSGIWTHTQAGSHHDSQMSAIVGIVCEKWLASESLGDMFLVVHKIHRILHPLLQQLDSELSADTQGPPEASQAIEEIFHLLNQALDKCAKVLVEEDLI